MTDLNNVHRPQRPKLLSARRLTLLGSVAVVGAALAFGGPVSFDHHSQSFWTAAQAAETQQGPAGFADLVAKVKPAVISVSVKIDQSADASMQNDMPNDEQQTLPPSMRGTPFEKFFRQFGDDGTPPGLQRHQIISGQGSGFFISADGYAVTNNHVVDHATSVQVTTDDGKKYTAKVIGTDPKTDIALIKVENASNLPYVKFGDQAPRVGDWVVAVGNPFGLGGTVTAGIVSAQGRNIGSGAYDYLQIDAPINKGNSGGPAFDMNGNVVGVNTAIFSPSGGSVGIGFDVPAETAKSVIAQLKDKGVVTRGWLGVQIQPVTQDIADSLGIKKAEGALVAETQGDSPAAKAGLEAGDVITSVNGTTISDSRDLARHIGALAPDTSVKLDVIHKGETKTVTVALGTMPNQREANAEHEQSGSHRGVAGHLGLSVAPASEVAGSGNKGVVVTGVDPQGPAAERGMQTGDVILDVGGNAVNNAGEIREALAKAKADGKRDVLMRVKSADNTRYVALPVG
jgi:serine protease Do